MTPSSPKPWTRLDVAALVLILFVAAGLRLGAPGITEFKRDEANLSRLALDMARGRDFPLLGLSSSVNIPNPPVSVYLFVPPFIVSDNPMLATLYVGALNVLAVALTWWLIRRYYGSLAAAVAGLLYAASPWAILYSRKIWAQDILPPFIVATVIAALLGFAESKRWARWAVWPLLALTIQIHYAAIVLVPLVFLAAVLWWHPTRDFLRDHAVGLGLVAFVVLPALAGAVRDDWLDLNRIRAALESNPPHDSRLSTTALDYAWFTIAGTNIHSLAGPDQYRSFLDRVPNLDLLFKLIPLGALLTAGGLLWHTMRSRGGMGAPHPSPDPILVGWLFLPVVVFTYEWTEVVPHYMIPLMPAAYSLFGIGLATLLDILRNRTLRHVAQITSGILITALIIAQLELTATLLHFLDRNATPGGFGTPLHYLLDARQAILNQQPETVLVVSEHDRLTYFEAPAVWNVLLESLTDVRFVDGTSMAVIPANSGLELISWSRDLKTCDATPCLVSDSARTHQFDRRPGEPPIIVRPIAADPWHARLTPLEPIRFSNETRLTGYTLEAGSVLLAWQINEPAQRDYQVFVHALDASGQRLAQADRGFWPGNYWQAGDTVYVWLDLAVPQETAALYAGMYWFEADGTPRGVEVLDAYGAYLDQAATIPLE